MSIKTITNGILTVSVDTIGAEIKSIKNMNEEFIWNGDKKYWANSAPILFPICGGLINDKYTFEDKEYTLEKHGFVRKKEFQLYEQTENNLVFLLKDDEETLKQYPFNFELYISFVLKNNSVVIEYKVKNSGSKNMYYSIGSHEAYSCPEGIEEYNIKFDKIEDFKSYILDGNLLNNQTISVLENTDTINLKYDYFKIDALVFKNLKSTKAVLKNKNGKKITLDFDGFNYFLLWTKPNAPYICLEPWRGIPDSVNANGNLTEKEGIIKLEKGKTSISTHTITFEI